MSSIDVLVLSFFYFFGFEFLFFHIGLLSTCKLIELFASILCLTRKFGLDYKNGDQTEVPSSFKRDQLLVTELTKSIEMKPKNFTMIHDENLRNESEDSSINDVLEIEDSTDVNSDGEEECLSDVDSINSDDDF